MSEDRPPFPAVASLLVAAVALLVYLPALGNGFTYDDVPLVLGDPRVLGGLAGDPLGTLGAIFARPYWSANAEALGLYRPLTTLSLALDGALVGADPLLYHLVNVALHALVAAFVFLLLRDLFAIPAALAGALLFAVHPVHVEAVANIAGRAELLAAAAALAAAVAWSGAWHGHSGDGVPSLSPRRLAAAVGFYALALLSKESAAVLPALLLLVDAAHARGRVRLRELARARVREVGALALVLAGFLAVRLAVIGGFGPALVHPAADVLPGRIDRLLTAFQAWPHYLRLLLWPRTLLIDYGPAVIQPATSLTPPVLLGFAILAALVAGGALALRAGRGRLALGLLWLPVATLAVSNLLITVGVLVAERTLYLPSVALSVAAAAAATLVLRQRALPRRPLVIGGLAILAALAARSVVRAPEWESTTRIFAAQLRDRPDSFRAHWYLGRVARAENDVVTALAHFERAMTLWPYRDGLILETASTYVLAGRQADAARVAEHGVAHWPANVDLHRLRAGLALDRGDVATARASIDAGLRVAPDDPLLNRMRASLETTP